MVRRNHLLPKLKNVNFLCIEFLHLQTEPRDFSSLTKIRILNLFISLKHDGILISCFVFNGVWFLCEDLPVHIHVLSIADLYLRLERY